MQPSSSPVVLCMYRQYFSVRSCWFRAAELVITLSSTSDQTLKGHLSACLIFSCIFIIMHVLLAQTPSIHSNVCHNLQHVWVCETHMGMFVCMCVCFIPYGYFWVIVPCLCFSCTLWIFMRHKLSIHQIMRLNKLFVVVWLINTLDAPEVIKFVFLKYTIFMLHLCHWLENNCKMLSTDKLCRCGQWFFKHLIV